MKGFVRLWLVPVVVAVVLLALVTALGGFRSGKGAQGRPAAAEEVLDLARWQLVVHAVELIPAEEYDLDAGPAVRVQLRATFTGMLSVYGLSPGLVTVASPMGALGVKADAQVDGPRNGDFDPDVGQEITMDFRWPDAPVNPPPVIRVLVRDERPGENYLFDETSWVLAPAPLAHVDLPCPDQR